MKNLIILLVIAAMTFAGCNKVDVPKGTPKCIRQEIQEILTEPVWNPPAAIYSYTYEGETVYFFPAHCCDIPSRLYDEKCNLICMPDGGITGQGDGQCTDFFGTRTDEEFLWFDDRI